MSALHPQAALQEAPTPTAVFARPDDTPLRPQRVLNQLPKRAAEIGLPKIGLHNLRHATATIMIAADIPLAVVSKTIPGTSVAGTTGSSTPAPPGCCTGGG
jgi:site-specific recombinase XerD